MPHFSLRSRILWPEIHNICNHIPFLSSPYLCHRTLFHQSVHPRSLWCSSHSRSPTHHPGIWPYGTPLVSQMRDGSSADGLLGPPHSVFSPFKAPCPGVVAEDPSSGSDQCPSLFSEYLSLHRLCIGRDSLIAQMVKKSSCHAGDPGQFLNWEDPLEEEMATHSSILAWRIQWTV